MTIHGIQPTLPLMLNGLSDVWQRRRSDIDSIRTATQGGNLEAARNAVASLHIDTNAPSAAGAAPDHQGVDQFRSDLKTLLDAVRNGDLAGAQQALAALEQDMPGGYGPQGNALSVRTWSITITFTAASVSGSAADSGTVAPAGGTNTETAAGAKAAADPDADGDTHAAGSAASPASTTTAPDATTPASLAPVAQNPFKALFDAIKAGDLTAAQQALGAIETAMQQMHGHHHHHHHHHGHSQAADGTTAATDATSVIRKPGATRDGGPQRVADDPTLPTTTEFPAPTA